ncbi:hypothetical protein E4T56_gene12232 [Termitomyces sp. T112]|nr:hypothetical protein E4T56_gene12232 [Termitomyces sp. T112]KAH0581440.1 hypothetical protein H2248_012521 [Termitomyces sp. 'cryptogamus']
MHRTIVRQQMIGGADRFMGGMGTGSGPRGNNNVMLGVAALVGITGLVYWLGYRDMDKRHKNDGPRKA